MTMKKHLSVFTFCLMASLPVSGAGVRDTVGVAVETIGDTLTYSPDEEEESPVEVPVTRREVYDAESEQRRTVWRGIGITAAAVGIVAAIIGIMGLVNAVNDVAEGIFG